MTAPPSVHNDDLRDALQEAAAAALDHLHAAFGVRLARYLKRVTWGLLSPEDLQDAYQETLLAFWKQTQAVGFDPEQPLRLAQTIAQRKGLDALRRRGHRPATNQESLMSAIETDLQSSRLGIAWCKQMGPAERQELRQVLLDTIAALPERQRLVARVYLDHFEDFGQRDLYEPLTRAVAEVTGQAENVQAIKSLWRAARTALAAELTRRGYALE
jgi:RNA polymerase sigma factor (sigma-70 family)